MIVPYNSQWAPGATTRINDCGQTCGSMLLAALGINVTVDSLRVGDSTGLTTPQNLVDMFSVHGVQAHIEKVSSLDSVKPNSILLVNYTPLAKHAQDVNFRGWHWLIYLENDGSNAVVHDPDYWGARINEGNRKQYPLLALKSALLGYSGGTGTAVVVDGLMPMPAPKTIEGKPYRVIAPVNYRQWYSTTAAKIGELNAGVIVIGYNRTYINGKHLWREVDHGGATGWVADEYLKVVS